MDEYNYLEKIYTRQHYFIDRHDSMAEKYISILLIELTSVSFIFAFLGIKLVGSIILLLITLLVFLIAFTSTLCFLLNTIQPLSSKAKKSGDESLLNNENKKWISGSSYYYQGIVSQINQAQEQEKTPSEEYLKTINAAHLSKDLVQQIFILAQYNNYKKERLENATRYMKVTAITALISVSIPIIMQCAKFCC